MPESPFFLPAACMNSAEPLLPQSVDGAAKQRIRFGIILLPNFTLTAFSGFVDMLRLSADEGDYSKPVRCSWSVIGDARTMARVGARRWLGAPLLPQLLNTRWTLMTHAGAASP